MIHKNAYCAPDDDSQESYKKDKTCFTASSLRKLAMGWNQRYGEPKIHNISHGTKKYLWTELHQRMKHRCRARKGAQEGCWVDMLQMDESSEPYQDLRPPTPAEWYKNPNTWLTNYDIEDVLEQYDREEDYKYHFLGVFPMDFADVYQELDVVRWEHLTKNGTCSYIGMVTNLDNHDEPGSHWTSLFAVLDPSLPNFGAYYYDSVASPPTPEIKEFMIKLMKRATIASLQKKVPGEVIDELNNYPIPQYTRGGAKEFMKKVHEVCEANKVYTPRPFRLEYNTHQHQYKNTECGVFSIIYQLRWIEALRENPRVPFHKIVTHRMKDEEIEKFRKKLFRPNTRVVIEKGIEGGNNLSNALKKETLSKKASKQNKTLGT